MKASQVLALAFAAAVTAAPCKNNGTTIWHLGQNWLDEWNGFIEGAGKTPSGISVYGNIYEGIILPEAEELVAAYAAEHNGYIQLGLTWKDDMVRLGGYSQFEGAKVQHDIAAGRWDEGLNRMVEYMASYPDVTWVVRPDYEVTGFQHANTAPDRDDPSTYDRTAYPAAYKHVREAMLAKLDNVKFIFHPMRGNAEILYPGDDVVDFQGISFFNNDICLPVANIRNCDGGRIDPNAEKDLNFATKPLVVSESGMQPPYSDTAEGSIEFLEKLKGIVEERNFAHWFWINSDWPSKGWPSNVWGDTRIESKPEVLEWFNANIVGNKRYVFEA